MFGMHARLSVIHVNPSCMLIIPERLSDQRVVERLTRAGCPTGKRLKFDRFKDSQIYRLTSGRNWLK